MNEQVKARLSAVREFLAGRSGDAKVAATEDKATREMVAAELLATMSGRAAGEAARADDKETSRVDTQEIPRFNAQEATPNETKDEQLQEVSQSEGGATSGEGAQLENSQEQERARILFLDHGYFDEAVEDLRASNAPAVRAAAARALGMVGSPRATAHLIAAVFDDDPEVRGAAEEALNRIGDPNMANVHVDALLENDSEEMVEAESTGSKSTRKIRKARGELKVVSRKSMTPPQGGRGTSAEVEAETLTASGGEVETSIPQSSGVQTTTAELTTTTDSMPTSQEEQLLLEENEIRETVEQLALQLLEITAARKESEQEVQKRTEHEANLSAEAAARRKKEEELRKRKDEEAERLRVQEREAVAAEQVARVKAELEAQHLAEEETSLRLKAAALRLAAEKLARERTEREARRRESAETALRAEATQARDEATLRHDTELERLRSEEQSLSATTDEIAQRRAEVETAREKADVEAARLVEAQGRMRAAEEARVEAETERAQLETEINQQVETALQLLEETRRRGREEQERLQEETRRNAEEEKRRLAEMEATRTRAEANSLQMAEKEQQILTEINSLRIADAETRKRIEDAEVRRRAAEDAYRLAAERVQRVEAEAHARAKEEEQMLAKLETERRTVAVGAQSRAAQEKRIREELEMFSKLEEQERPRLEAAILQRTEAEARLQQLRASLKAEEQARIRAEQELNDVGSYENRLTEQPAASDRPQLQPEYPSEPISFATGKARETFTDAPTVAADNAAGTGGGAAELEDVIEDAGRFAAAGVTPSVVVYLNSVDPYKRAAAVAELARSGSKDAFSLIVRCFDDHSPHVRNAAARAFRKLEPHRTVDLFNRALEEAPSERRRNIGAAIAASGLATEAIDNLISENREDTYNALSILFVMAKTGEVQPLIQAIEGHESVQVRMAAIKLLTLTGQPDIADAAAKRRLEGHSHQ